MLSGILRLAILCLAGVAYYSIYGGSLRTPATLTTPSKTPIRKISTEPDVHIDRICLVFFALNKIAPLNSPELAPTPLGLLQLDSNDRLFRQPDQSAHPGAPLHAQMHAVISAHESRVRADAWPGYQHSDPLSIRVVDASWLVGDMFRDDQLRLYFLVRIQPHLKETAPSGGGRHVWHTWFAKVGAPAYADVARAQYVQQLCRASWDEQGWVEGRVMGGAERSRAETAG